MSGRRDGLFFGGAIVAVIATVAAAFWVIGSPADERARRIDDRRVDDLRGIRASVDLFWSRRERLPESLQELSDEPGVTVRTRDPVTEEPYGYRVLDSIRFQVCGVFELESEATPASPRADVWSHGAGRHCFEREAGDPERRDRVGSVEVEAGGVRRASP